jgi:hypothetical protein
MALPHLWRGRIFATSTSTARLVRKIASWYFYPAHFGGTYNEIFIQLAEPRLHDLWAVQAIEPNSVADLHDAMIVHRLWDLVGLSDWLGPPTVNPYLDRCALGKDLRELMIRDPLDVKKDCLGPVTGPIQMDTQAIDRSLDMLTRAHFALRVLGIPDLVPGLMKKEEFNYTADEVQAKIIEVTSTLGIEPRDAYPHLYQPLSR